MGMVVLIGYGWMNEQHQEAFHVLLLGENKILMSYVWQVEEEGERGMRNVETQTLRWLIGVY